VTFFHQAYRFLAVGRFADHFHLRSDVAAGVQPDGGQQRSQSLAGAGTVVGEQYPDVSLHCSSVPLFPQVIKPAGG